MGGGAGSHGSGVAGGYTGSGQTQEKQDWLDKGIEFAGKKAGMNVVSGVVSAVSVACAYTGARATPMPTKLVTF